MKDDAHMEELIDLLNRQAEKKDLGVIDPLIELQIYSLKQATMSKNPDPNFEAILQEIEINAKRPSEALHKLWMIHAENPNEGQQYESE